MAALTTIAAVAGIAAAGVTVAGALKKPKTTIDFGPTGPATPEERRSFALQEASQRAAIEQAGFDIQEDASGALRLVPKAKTEREQVQERIGLLSARRLEQALTGEIPPETRRLVGETFTGARTSGEEDIRRFAIELAGARGLNLSDTPIGGEALRAQERLTTGLRSAEAGALLDVTNRERLFNQSLQEFRENLAQRAFQNRLALSAQAGQTGLGLSALRTPGARTITGPLDLTGVARGLSGLGTSLGGLKKLS